MFRFGHRPRHTRQITLYMKPGCHLCDDARDLLVMLENRYPMVITEIDVRSDPQLYRQYDVRIPVIVIDGRFELEAPITAKELRNALRG